MAEKLRMASQDTTKNNIERIAELFPSCITETVTKDGIVKHQIDFEALRTELSDDLVDEYGEKYQFTWPGKNESKMLANSPISMCLRPCEDESVDFDTTKNLYIKGDNLDVLKLLRETYYKKVKMIYIDPPYNTGGDSFVYGDDYRLKLEEYAELGGDFSEEGYKLTTNSESNGRLHTDWLNMMYPRLRLARDFLTDDGVIIISIDDNEQANLKKMCDEIFGETNFIANVIWQKRTSPDARKKISSAHEYLLFYGKNERLAEESFNLLPLDDKDAAHYSNPDNDPRGPWVSSDFTAQGYRPNQMYTIVTPGGVKYSPPQGVCWKQTEEGFNKLREEGRIWFGSDGKSMPRKKLYLSEREGKNIWTWWPNTEVGHTQEATKQLSNILGDKTIFDYPKPTKLLKRILQITADSNSVVMDFFSGSATLAQAVMEMNAEKKMNIQYILVQIPEQCGEDSGALKAGFKTICDIALERIRRVGIDIKKQSTQKTLDHSDYKLDVGFRVFNLDSSNMEDMYYTPEETTQAKLDNLVDNVKKDRSSEDLLYQTMLEFNIPLSASIRREKVDGRTVFVVNDDELVACFDRSITEKTVEFIAKNAKSFAVIRDGSIDSDSTATNFEQIFKTYNPNVDRKVL